MSTPVAELVEELAQRIVVLQDGQVAAFDTPRDCGGRRAARARWPKSSSGSFIRIRSTISGNTSREMRNDPLLRPLVAMDAAAGLGGDRGGVFPACVWEGSTFVARYRIDLPRGT